MQFIETLLADRAVAPAGVAEALSALRRHLGMSVAYISEFDGNDSVFTTVDAPGLEAVIKPGDRRSLDEVYCRHIIAGRLPQLIPDTAQNAFAQTLPITRDSHIGAHMSVPLHLPDGTVHGMFCCLDFEANPSLNQRDLQMMRVFADMTARHIGAEAMERRSVAVQRRRIADVLSERNFQMVFQPIWDFARDRPMGFEALCRFPAEPYRPPNLWFKDAAAAGLGIAMEMAAIEAAVEAGAALPSGYYLSVNASPDVVLSGKLPALVRRQAGRRIVVEVTEHAPIADYPQLLREVARLREAGALIAVDDAGAGYAGLQHILQLRPDIIKLDLALVRSIDTDAARRALVAALLFFAEETGCLMVAEGIETKAELAILRQLGVHCGQGYLFSRPGSIDLALAMATSGAGPAAAPRSREDALAPFPLG